VPPRSDARSAQPTFSCNPPGRGGPCSAAHACRVSTHHSNTNAAEERSRVTQLTLALLYLPLSSREGWHGTVRGCAAQACPGFYSFACQPVAHKIAAEERATQVELSPRLLCAVLLRPICKVWPG
jgi:hypothetical protein